MQFFDELRNQLKCDSDSPPQNYKSTFSFVGSFLLVLCILAHVYVSWRSRSIISVFNLQLHFCEWEKNKILFAVKAVNNVE